MTARPSTVQDSQTHLFTYFGHMNLVAYWRISMKAWVREIWSVRHQLDSAGWRKARQGFWFARALFRSGNMTKAEFRRWWRFAYRLQNLGRY